MAIRTTGRIDFLDNIRALAIMCLVIFYHPAVAYSTVIAEHLNFYFVEPTYLFYDVIALFFDIFLMPFLFLIAGFFALPSLKKRSAKRYIVEKFVHVMIPFFLGVFLLNAFPNYIKGLFHHQIESGYMFYWGQIFLKNIGTFFLEDKASVHLWFLSLLFLFYLTLTVVYKVDPKWFEKSTETKKLSSFFLLCFALVGAICFFIINFFMPDFGAWVNFEFFWTFQFTRFPLYVLYFFLGVFCYKNGWMTKGFFLLLWLIIALIITPINLYVIIHFFGHLFETWYLKALHACLHSFSCLGLCLSIIEISKKGLNFSNSVLRLLSSNGYAIYILHFNFFIGIEFFLYTARIPTILKYLISGVLAYFISLVISQGILRWIPGLNYMLYGKRKKL